MNHPGELFSDESSFYGSDTEIADLEDLANTFDPEPYWRDVHPHLLSTVQQKLQSGKPTTGIDDALQKSRGKTESAPEFRNPSTTDSRTAGPWIFARSPHVDRRMENGLPTLVGEGTKLLYEFEDKQADLEAAHAKSNSRSTAGLTRKLNPLRRTLEKEIFALARRTGVVSGKWMLFPSVREVDRAWASISGATVRGELGIVAKVATHDVVADRENKKPRLICVYTRDYEDREDVRRVLMGLMELGLVRRDDKPIYYKCDAFTHLQLNAGNPYGLKTSLFSSRDVLNGKF